MQRRGERARTAEIHKKRARHQARCSIRKAAVGHGGQRGALDWTCSRPVAVGRR